MPDDAGSATPISVGDFLAKLSEFYPYGDEPPRLCAALNDARTDAPDGTVFDDATGTVREHHIEQPYDDKTVISILEWISRRLGRTFIDAWFSQMGCMVNWMDPSEQGIAEETWAQAVAEAFLGTVYSGPLQLYNMGVPLLPRMPDGSSMRRADSESWEQYCFRRISQSHPRQALQIINDRAYGAYELQSWDNPAPIELDPYDGLDPWMMHENTDPAIPIGVACQHQTTYGALTRGIPLDWLGDATNPAVGFMASDACSGMPAFGVLGKPGGPSPYGGAEPLVTDPSPPGKWVAPTPQVTILSNAMAEGFGPGSIVVLDPDSGAGVTSVTLYLSDYEKQPHIYRSVLKQYFFSRSAVGSSQFGSELAKEGRKAPADTYVKDVEGKIALNESRIERLNKQIADLDERAANSKSQEEKFKATEESRQKKFELEDAKKKRTYLNDQKTLAAKEATSAYVYKFNEQLPGSHIYFVLRVRPDKKAWQAYDVSVGEALAHLKPTGADVILNRQGMGHMDGYKMTDIPSGEGKQLAGLGVLPQVSADSLSKSAAFLRSARTVGLCRLVISERGRTVNKKYYPGLADKNQVLFASRLLLMYGTKPDQNYRISNLMWAIRNTPGLSDLQCWWVVFAPQGLLARSMWAEGAREMTLKKFIDTFYEHEEWGFWSFFHADYAPWLGEMKKPSDALIPQKRKKAYKKLNYGTHYSPHIVLTNEGDKNIAGKVAFVCRWNNGEGNETGKAKPMDPPSPLTSILKSLAWDQIYLRKDLETHRKAIEDAMPEFFKGEPEAEETEAQAAT